MPGNISQERPVRVKRKSAICSIMGCSTPPNEHTLMRPEKVMGLPPLYAILIYFIIQGLAIDIQFP